MDKSRDLKSKLYRRFETYEETQYPEIAECQYHLAIRGLNLQSEEIEIGKRMLVDRESPRFVSKSMEINLEKAIQVKTIILQNFYKQLQQHKLEMKSYIIPKEREMSTKLLEIEDLQRDSN